MILARLSPSFTYFNYMLHIGLYFKICNQQKILITNKILTPPPSPGSQLSVNDKIQKGQDKLEYKMIFDET